MKLMRAVLLVAGLGQGALAQEWRSMTGAEITGALTERTLIYERARQSFYGSGKTLYTAGADSWGYWRVEGNQYCSMWPPQDLWACYDMQRSGPDRLRFIGAAGDITEAVYGD